MADDNATVLIEGWAHNPFAAEALGLLQRRLDVGDIDIEDGMAFVTGTSSDPARDSDAILGCDAVDEGVAIWLGDLRCNGGVLGVGQPKSSP